MALQPPPPPPPPPPPLPTCRKACAACAKMKKRCPPDCIFARYFLDDPDTLANIHSLFGFENSRRHLTKVRPEEQQETARSMGIEANLRKQYPVNGPLEVIDGYENLIAETQIELATIQASIQQLKMAQFSTPLYDLQDQLENTAGTSMGQYENTENHEIS